MTVAIATEKVHIIVRESDVRHELDHATSANDHCNLCRVILMWSQSCLRRISVPIVLVSWKVSH